MIVLVSCADVLPVLVSCADVLPVLVSCADVCPVQMCCLCLCLVQTNKGTLRTQQHQLLGCFAGVIVHTLCVGEMVHRNTALVVGHFHCTITFGVDAGVIF